MISCPICSHVNPAGTARCEKCDSWLALANDVGLKPQVRSETSRGNPGSPLTPQFAEELLTLGREGRMIEAIKLFREATGLGLRESKEAVEALVAGRGLPNVANRANVPAEEAAVVALLRAGNVIGAIKQHRTETGLGLKEAKDAVEAIARKHGITPKQTGCGSTVLVGLIVCLLAVAVPYLMR